MATTITFTTLASTLSAIPFALDNNYIESTFANNDSTESEFSAFDNFQNSSFSNMTFGDNLSNYSDTSTEGRMESTIPLLTLVSSDLPENFQKLNAYSRNLIIAYFVLLLIGGPLNLFVFVSVGREIWRKQLVRSRIKVLIFHLCLADLLVIFIVIPIEVVWRLTIQFFGGDFLCKLSQFFRAFGLFLSSMIIICISLDRFFAIVFPLKVIGGMKRVRNMLCVAWTSSILFAAPQVLVFRVQRHPIYPSFLLCSNSEYFHSASKEIMYNLLSLIVMYFAPLIVIIVTYAMVLCTIARKSREHQQDCRPRSGSNQLRRSDNASNITRARRKTLWLSMSIVTVFVICWTPYVATTLWYMFDFYTANKMVDPQTHEAFFLTAVSNSCMNPLFYASNYMQKYWRNLRNVACRSRNSSTSSSRIVSSSRMHHNIHAERHHRGESTHRCTNQNHHFNLRRCQSGASTSVTIVLKEYPTSQLGLGRGTVSTATTSPRTSISPGPQWYL